MGAANLAAAAEWVMEVCVQKEAEYTLFLEQVGKRAERCQAMLTTHLSVNTARVGAAASLFKGGTLGRR